MRLRLAVLTAVAFALPALAHEMWLQPSRFSVPPDTRLSIKWLVGEAADVTSWPFRWDKLVSFKSFGPNGMVDRQAAIAQTGSIDAVELQLREPGTHVVALESYQQPHDMEAAPFNAYLLEDGLAAVSAHRRATGAEAKPGREVYSRRAKALVQVGGVPTSNVTQAIGQTLEIVPERNPYAMGGTKVPVRVLYQGRMLPGALVLLTPLGIGSKPVQRMTTGMDGRSMFDIPRRGAWMISVVWSRPVTGNKLADYDTIFASLTFGY